MVKRSVKILDEKSSYLPYYAEASNEWRGSSPRYSVWATRRSCSGGGLLVILYPIQELNPKPHAPVAMCLSATPTNRSQNFDVMVTHTALVNKDKICDYERTT